MNQITVKLVFLIDSKSACKDGQICERTLAAIRLAVLKTLTHLSSSGYAYGNTAVREKLKWGFKIFDSAKECQIYRKRAGWLQHTHRNFLEFENHLRDEISCRCEKIRRKNSVARRSANQANSSTQIRPSSGYDQISVSDKAANEDEADDSSSAYAVRYALQDVMNDFQWEEPDMCSPTKKSFSLSLRSARPRKRTDSVRLTNSTLTTNRESVHNSSGSGAISKISVTDGRQKDRRKERMVFLVMECPTTVPKMEDFVGDATKLQSVQVLRETLIAKDFLMDFCANKSTSLFWLDSSLDSQGNANGELLNQVLCHVNGHLISVRGLLSNDDHVTSCLHSLGATHQAQEEERLKEGQNQRKCEEDEYEEDDLPAEKIPVPRSFFPLSAIMQYHFGACQDDMNSSSSFPSASFEAGLCTRRGAVRTIHCVLRVMPMFSGEMDLAPTRALNSAVESDTPSYQSTKSSQMFAIHGIEEHWTGPRRRSQRSNPEAPTHQPPLFTVETGTQSEPTPPSSTQSSDENTVTIRAKIGREVVTLDSFESSKTFSCIGFECAAPSEQCGSNTQLSRWFMDAMMTLSKQKSALIVEVASPISSLVSMAIMEPLTPSLASIRLLHAKSVLSLVTVLAFQTLSSSGAQADNQGKHKKNSADRLRHFVESSARKILKGRGSGPKEEHTTDSGELSALPPSDPDTMEELAVIKAGPVNPFHPDWLEPWHISAPSRNSCDRIVEQLLSIPDDRPSPSLHASHDEEFMERIKGFISGKRGAEATVDLPHGTQPDGQGTEMAVREASSVRRSGRLKRIKSLPSFVGARTARIMANSRTLQATKPKSPVKEQKVTAAMKRKNDSITSDLPDFSVLEDLTTHLRQSYKDALSKNSCSLAFTQSTVALVLHFFKTLKESCNGDDSVAKMKELVSDNLLISSKQLRECYIQKSDDPEVRQVRVQEVEMQTLLRLEVESVAPVDVAAAREESRRRREETGGGDDDEEEEDSESDLPEPLQEVVNEIVSMLSTVPILASGDKLSTFLSDVLLSNYMETIPHILRAIYDGLMMPVPALLMSPGSDTTNLQSVLQPLSYRSVSSGGSLNAVGSNSNRSRALVRHPSLADAGPKRIIGVPTRHLQNEKKKTGVVEKQKPKKEQENDPKMVRRNLFTEESKNAELSRRKSVAVMESQALRRSPRKVMRSTKPVLKTRAVKETPGKKQVLKAMLNKLERARKHTNKDKVSCEGDLLVIEESPEKPVNVLHQDPRRSPRIRTLQRRPSFYSKKQEIHHAKLLAARIAGTYSQGTQPKEQSQLPEGKDSESKKEISSASFFLSKIMSPVAKEGNLLEDSPSRNTRSKVTGTPDKIKAGSSAVPVRGSKTTPRAKARRRLTDVLMEDDTLKPSTVNSVLTTGQSPFKSPAKSPGTTMNVVCRHSPRLIKRLGNSPPVTENYIVPGSSIAECREGSNPDSQGVQIPQWQSPRKMCRRTNVVIVEQSKSCGREETNNLNIMKNEIESEKNAVNITSAVSKQFAEKCSHSESMSEEGNKPNESWGKDESQHTGMTHKVEDVSMSSPRSLKQEDVPYDDITGQQLKEQATNAFIPSEEPMQLEESTWIDKIAMETPDAVQSEDKEEVIERKRKRATPDKVEVTTPISKSCFTKDASFPMSVPASKCTTPESINSWPRKKPRYNSPSSCTSKMQHPQNISPVEQIDEVLGRWTSPRTKRHTPQSLTKKCPATGSGRKRKRQSPGVTSSEKKRRGGDTTPKRLPRARGSLLSMLTAKASLEERCISPIFGKPSSNMSNATEFLHPTEDGKMKLTHLMKKQLPTGRGKSPHAKGNSSSMNSEGSLDELDRSFSPVFGKNNILYPGDSSQSNSSDSSVAGELVGRVASTITDQALDCDTESDPEVDFPKMKSHSSTGSDGQLSDWDAVMVFNSDGHMVVDMTTEERKPSVKKQRSRDMSKDAASGSRSLRRSESLKASSISPVGHSNQTVSRESTESKDVQRQQRQREDKREDAAVSPRRVLRKKSSSEKYLQEDLKGDSGGNVKEDNKASEAQSISVMVKPSAHAKANNMGDEENKRPKDISKQKRKKVTISSHLPQSLERKSTPSRLSMTLQRSSTGKDLTITDSPEPAALHDTASGDFSSLESSLSSADDEVFEAGSSSYTSPMGVASTPPTQSGKPNFVTTPLSASGLYSLMNSPMVDSAGCKVASGSVKTSRSSRTSRRNLPLQ